MNSFGRMLFEERKKKRVVLMELAKKIRLSPSIISGWERGQRPPPDEKTIKVLAEILDLDSEQLLAAANQQAEGF